MINKSKSEISIQFRYFEFPDWEKEIAQIRIQENRKEEIKFFTYKEMVEHQITRESDGVNFMLPSNHIAYIGLGYNGNLRHIREITIVDSNRILKIEEAEIEVQSRRGGYVGIYNYQ